jgi:hypothetical protein
VQVPGPGGWNPVTGKQCCTHMCLLQQTCACAASSAGPAHPLCLAMCMHVMSTAPGPGRCTAGLKPSVAGRDPPGGTMHCAACRQLQGNRGFGNYLIRTYMLRRPASWLLLAAVSCSPQSGCHDFTCSAAHWPSGTAVPCALHLHEHMPLLHTGHHHSHGRCQQAGIDLGKAIAAASKLHTMRRDVPWAHTTTSPANTLLLLHAGLTSSHIVPQR